MNKNFTLTFLVFLFGILFQQTSTAQTVANDDNLGSFSSGSTGYNILSNDLYNGAVPQWSDVTLTTVSVSAPGISIAYGTLTIAASVPPGNHSVVYKICSPNSTTNCDTATVTFSVCSLATPIISVVNATTCSESPIVNVSNLPAGQWTFSALNLYDGTLQTFSGAGNSAAFNISGAYYKFRVTDANGCQSNFTSGMDVGVFAQAGYNASLTATFLDLNSDGIKNFGDALNFHFHATNLLDCNINIEVSDEMDQAQFTAPQTITIAPGATDSSISGTYLLTQDDVASGTVNKWLRCDGETNGGSTIYQKVFASLVLASLKNDSFEVATFTAYPNPAQTVFTIESSSMENIKTVTIFGLQGQKVFRQNVNQKNTVIDVSNFSKGVYFVKIDSEKGHQSVKLVKD